MDKIIVDPLVQVGSIPFGSSRILVRNAFGKYHEQKKSVLSKNTMDDFGFCHVFYDERNKCEAFEFFPEIEIEIDNKVIFPGNIDSIVGMLGGFATEDSIYINSEKSIGISVKDGIMESILFARKGYYR